MNKVFDYIYYRLNQAYFKWDGRNGATSIVGLSMFQSMIIGDVIALIFMIFLNDNQIKANSKYLLYPWLVLFIVLIVFNVRKYKNRYNFLKAQWSTETRSQRIIHGLLVVLALAVPWVAIIIMSMIRETRVNFLLEETGNKF